MPCIIITGHPCAGKTALASKIRERALNHASGRIQNVVIVNEQSACPDHSIAACYATAVAEKKTRGALKSAFDRAVAAHSSNKTLIILDSSNYIKGFRYELFCISKAAASSHCVVWCLNDVVTVKEWNKKRRLETSNPDIYYSDELLEALILRYEPPDERNRWDKPLYRIDLRSILKQQTEIAGDVLDRSVYNMHNLSEAIGGGIAQSVESSEATAVEDTPVVKKSATFKRSTFKRLIKSSEQQVPYVKTGPLTAETLSSVAEPQVAPSSPTIPPLHEPGSAPEPQPIAVVQPPRSLEERIDEFLDSFLLNVQPLQEGTSTRQHVATESNVLHQVDSVTQQICSCIVSAQDKSATGTGRLPVALQGETMFLQCHRRLTAPELRRIRKQYIQWVVTHPPEDESERGIAQSFLAYIETQR